MNLLRPGLVAALFLGLTLLLTYWIYRPGLSGPMILDDYPQFDPILENIGKGSWTTGFLLSESGVLKRPVAMATFIFNAIVAGRDFWWWKFTNLAIHLLIGVLIFFLSERLLALEAGRIQRNARYLALLAAAIWLLHPLQVSTVLYTVQRMTQLSALFVFAGLLSYTLGREKQLNGRAYGWIGILLAFLVCFPLAMFSKENGLLFPVFTCLLEVFFFRFRGGRNARTGLAWCYTLFLLLPGLIVVYWLTTHFDQLVLRGYEIRNFTLYERVLTELRVVVYYLYQMVVPQQHNLGFFHDDFPVSKGLLSPPSTLLSLGLLTAVLAAGWSLRRFSKAAAFGIFFFFAAHLLESTIFPLELMFEHRNYLALYGILLSLCCVVGKGLNNRMIVNFLALAIGSVFTVVTVGYVDTWTTRQDLYTRMFVDHPLSPRLRINLASDYTEDGEFDKARRMLAGFSGQGFDLQRAYVSCRQLGRLSQTELKHIAFRSDSKVTTYELQGLVELANLGLDEKCAFPPEEYLRIASEALSAHIINDRSAQSLWIYKAHYLHKTGKFEDALAALEAAFRAYDSNSAPLFLATEWLVEAKDKIRAESYFARAQATAEKSHQDFSAEIDSIRTHIGNL
ncbi:MAG: hypothetical protein ACREUV_08955 [Burkholderiales bacterium]